MQLGRVSLQRQLEFLHDLHEWLQAGRTPEQGLQGFERVLETASRLDERDWLRHIRAALQKGLPLGTGVQATFSSEVITLLNLGQRYGCLGKMLDAFRTAYELRQGMYKRFFQQLAYPLALVLVSIMATIFIGQQVLPRFLDSGTSAMSLSNGGLPWLLNGLAHMFSLLMPIGFVTLALASATLWWLLPRWQGEWRRDLDTIFPFRVYRRLQAIKLLQHLAMFLGASVSMQISIRQLQDAAPPYVRKHLNIMLHRLHQGEPDMMKVLNTGLIDATVWFRLQCQDQRSALCQRLSAAAAFAQRDLVQLIQRRQRILAFTCYSLSGLLVVGILAAMGQMFAEFARA
ncbi:hypothetical protein FM042_00280 [Aliidiomarina halalkaliphila]|uniref:Type II secretion system protein GspF domain-containing protein n=1 Tax=Aliidiomarina halalkaliphila TaxID=2593535 RepID=A0A552X385_9GAMM|nr:type II secretion system F family protein [Aliidiomarina halalkaliphila]TRW49349.1 hypothetical protein FM042_00280 [Aliidiomarina halalkaliphila]